MKSSLTAFSIHKALKAELRTSIQADVLRSPSCDMKFVGASYFQDCVSKAMVVI